jgi:hypothetical protein
MTDKTDKKGCEPDDEIMELDDDELREMVHYVLHKVNALQFHLDVIRDTDDKELAGVCLEAAEEIYPGTKEKIRNREAQVYYDVADKCMAFGLL